MYLSVQRLIWKSRLLRKVEAVINLIHNQKPKSEVDLKLTIIANDAKITEGGRQNSSEDNSKPDHVQIKIPQRSVC